MNNNTNQTQDKTLCKKSYESPEVNFFDMQYNNVIDTSNPDDRGEWDVNPTKPGGNR